MANAIKFTFEGEIKVTVKVEEGNKRLLRLSVDDTGIGIKESDCDKLFQMFSMLADS